MSDRLTEIEARLEKANLQLTQHRNVESWRFSQGEFAVNAPDDIAWLVAEVRRLQSESNSVNAADHSPKLLPSQPANGEPQQTWEPSGPERSRTRGTSLFPPNDPAHRFTQMCEYEAAMTQMEAEIKRLRNELKRAGIEDV